MLCCKETYPLISGCSLTSFTCITMVEGAPDITANPLMVNHSVFSTRISTPTCQPKYYTNLFSGHSDSQLWYTFMNFAAHMEHLSNLGGGNLGWGTNRCGLRQALRVSQPKPTLCKASFDSDWGLERVLQRIHLDTNPHQSQPPSNCWKRANDATCAKRSLSTRFSLITVQSSEQCSVPGLWQDIGPPRGSGNGMSGWGGRVCRWWLWIRRRWPWSWWSGINNAFVRI